MDRTAFHGRGAGSRTRRLGARSVLLAPGARVHIADYRLARSGFPRPRPQAIPRIASERLLHPTRVFRRRHARSELVTGSEAIAGSPNHGAHCFSEAGHGADPVTGEGEDVEAYSALLRWRRAGRLRTRADGGSRRQQVEATAARRRCWRRSGQPRLGPFVSKGIGGIEARRVVRRPLPRRRRRLHAWTNFARRILGVRVGAGGGPRLPVPCRRCRRRAPRLRALLTTPTVESSMSAPR